MESVHVELHLDTAGRAYPCRECGATIQKGARVVVVPTGWWDQHQTQVKVCLRCGEHVARKTVAAWRKAHGQIKAALAAIAPQVDEADEGGNTGNPIPCSDCGTPVPEGTPFYASPCGTFCLECMGAHMEECGVCAKEFEFL